MHECTLPSPPTMPELDRWKINTFCWTTNYSTKCVCVLTDPNIVLEPYRIASQTPGDTFILGSSPVSGIPEKPCFFLMLMTSPTLWLGLRTRGSRIKPCLNFLTLRTSSAWSSMLQLWWIIPGRVKFAIVVAVSINRFSRFTRTITNTKNNGRIFWHAFHPDDNEGFF